LAENNIFGLLFMKDLRKREGLVVLSLTMFSRGFDPIEFITKVGTQAISNKFGQIKRKGKFSP